jgi:hypothetical protein
MIYKDGAKTYAEGAVSAKGLRWSWDDRRARGRGQLDEPANDPGHYKRGRVTLRDPVEDCGELVFSNASYSFRARGAKITERYRIYTC